jgi:DNA-binding MarR family transcriptional regulator
MALRVAYLAMHRRTDAVMARDGVTADQFVVLYALSEAAALTQRELVEKTASDPNTLRAMLVLLEARGLLRRRAHPTDGRARRVSLTKKGRRAFERLWRRSEALRREMVMRLSTSEVAELARLLRRFAAAIGTSNKRIPGGRTSS